MTMKRVNITVPEKMLDAMRKKPKVNWSAVAREAFRAVLNDDELSLTDRGTLIRRLRKVAGYLNHIIEEES